MLVESLMLNNRNKLRKAFFKIWHLSAIAGFIANSCQVIGSVFYISNCYVNTRSWENVKCSCALLLLQVVPLLSVVLVLTERGIFVFKSLFPPSQLYLTLGSCCFHCTHAGFLLKVYFLFSSMKQQVICTYGNIM